MECWHLAANLCPNLCDDLWSHLSRCKVFPLTMRNVVWNAKEFDRGDIVMNSHWMWLMAKAFLRRQKKRQMLSREGKRVEMAEKVVLLLVGWWTVGKDVQREASWCARKNKALRFWLAWVWILSTSGGQQVPSFPIKMAKFMPNWRIREHVS